MNNGWPNQAIRCFHRVVDQFVARVRSANPNLETIVVQVQPRNLGEAPPDNCDLYLSTGGPGSPYDGYDEHWSTLYRKFLDTLVDDYACTGDCARSVFLVCHSFELAVMHFGVATMAEMPRRKFGIQPVYMTPAGMRSPLLAPFGDRLFAWENRGWHAVDLNQRRLDELKGELWARESRESLMDKGRAKSAFLFAPGVEGVQFHPEADHNGAAAWLRPPDKARAAIEAFGELTYTRMLRTLDMPDRLARTFVQLIPGWLTRKFNARTELHGWNPLPVPTFDRASALAAFGAISSSRSRPPEPAPNASVPVIIPPPAKEPSCL